MATIGLPTGEDSTSENEGFRSCGSGRCSGDYEDTEGSVETVSFDSEDDLLPEDFTPGGGGKTPDDKKCWFAEEYSRKCDTHEKIINTATAQECLSECLSNSMCHVATWHPASQRIFPDESDAVCLMYPLGTPNCELGGSELVRPPGAVKIQCANPKDRFLSFSDRLLKRLFVKTIFMKSNTV